MFSGFPRISIIGEHRANSSLGGRERAAGYFAEVWEHIFNWEKALEYNGGAKEAFPNTPLALLLYLLGN